MDSQAAMKLMKLFYETPQAQEIYATLRRQREEQEANYESLFIDIPDEPVKKTTKQKKELDHASPNKAIQQDINYETFDEPFCNCDDELTTSATLFSECKSKLSQVFQTVETYDSLLQDNQTQRELLKWSLKIVNDKDIIVEGHRSGDPPDMSWRTSVICDRVSTNVVRSIKGTLYFLLGEIDEMDMIGKGFSKEIINMFKYGFPPDWRDIFSKTVSEQRERDNKVKVSSEKKTPVMVDDWKNESLNEEENAVQISDEKPTKQSDKTSRKRSSKKNIAKKETSEKKKPSSEPRRQKERKEETKRLLSNTIETDDAKEIEVKRSRSGRLICPVLDYWKGQRIDASQADVGEISIIKSNLEEDLRLTLVETSKNSSGVQNPTVSSTESTGTINTSGTEWTPGSMKTDSTSTNAARNLTRKNSARKVKNKSLQAKSQADEAIFTESDTDALEHEKPKNDSGTKSAKQRTTTRKSRKRKQSDEISESVTSAVEQEISKSTSILKPERIPKTSTTQTRNKVSLTDTSSAMTKGYPTKTSTRIDEESDAEQCDVKPNNFKTKSNTGVTRSYPKRTRIRFDERDGKNVKSYPSRTRTQRQIHDQTVTQNVVKPANSASSSRNTKQVKQPIKESQTLQPSKKLKVGTGKLTTKTGTLARKRELRDMLEQQDEGYEDDAFEGTPFRNQKLGRTHNISPVDITDSEHFPEEINDEDYRTPSNRNNRLRPPGPLSTGKSENDVMTPGLLNSVNRNNLDRYVNQLRRQKLRNIRKKVESHTPLAKKAGNNAHNIPEGVDYSFNIHTKSTAMDDEEGQDYYWSDND